MRSGTKKFQLTARHFLRLSGK